MAQVGMSGKLREQITESVCHTLYAKARSENLKAFEQAATAVLLENAYTPEELAAARLLVHLDIFREDHWNRQFNFFLVVGPDKSKVDIEVNNMDFLEGVPIPKKWADRKFVPTGPNIPNNTVSSGPAYDALLPHYLELVRLQIAENVTREELATTLDAPSLNALVKAWPAVVDHIDDETKKRLEKPVERATKREIVISDTLTKDLVKTRILKAA